MPSERATEMRDEQYDLISALYHMVEGAWKYEQYAYDAETAGDAELTELFREAQRQHKNLADRAKTLLGSRLT